MVAQPPFLEPPGRTARSYRSDEMLFKTAFVPEHALAAKRFVESNLRGPDYLQQRVPSWNSTTVLRDEPLKGMRRDEAIDSKLSTMFSGEKFVERTVHHGGWGGDPLGATLKGRFSKDTMPATASELRLTQRLETAMEAEIARKATLRGALGPGHRSIAFEKPFLASDSTPGGWSNSTEVGSTGLSGTTVQVRFNLLAAEREASQMARQTSQELLQNSKKKYISPMRAEQIKQKAIREAKAKGEWPNKKPPIEVIECTKRSKTRKQDLVAVAELDSFDTRVKGYQPGYKGL